MSIQFWQSVSDERNSSCFSYWVSSIENGLRLRAKQSSWPPWSQLFICRPVLVANLRRPTMQKDAGRKAFRVSFLDYSSLIEHRNRKDLLWWFGNTGRSNVLPEAEADQREGRIAPVVRALARMSYGLGVHVHCAQALCINVCECVCGAWLGEDYVPCMSSSLCL